MKDTVTETLRAYAEYTKARFHMPGHKGRDIGTAAFSSVLPFDVTELDLTDNLYDPAPDGIFRTELDFMRNVYGSFSTVVSAGGATAAICAAFTACVRRKTRIQTMSGLHVLCDRKAHLSVINALALTGLEPVWFDAETIGSNNLFRYSELYKNHGEDFFAAIFTTSPDYYGITRDISALAELAENLSVPLIVDNSHGSHLFFYRGGSLHPLRTGASLVIDSIHKTLPALTGAALLHSGKGSNASFNELELLPALRLFVSTSPSYLISSSVFACIREMAESGEKLHEELFQHILNTRECLTSYGYTLSENKGDPFRICIYDKRARELYSYLDSNGVVCEFTDGECVVLLTSVNNNSKDFDILTDLCSRFTPQPLFKKNLYAQTIKLPKRAISIREAMLARQTVICADSAAGRIAAAPAAPYPPGIPIIVPGEVYDTDIIAALKSASIKNCAVVCK